MRGSRTAGSIVLMAALPGMVLAQNPTSAPGLEEVVVTARKRQESVLNVPESMTVMTADTIENAGITNVRDFARLTPNVDFDSGTSPAYSVLTARGITTPQGAEAPMAIVVDGVQLSDMTFANVDLLNIERIEVLRGPQGSLYGRNAIAGAINIVSSKPTNDAELQGKVSLANGDDRAAQAAVSGPIVEDRAFFSLVGAYREFDGTYENVFLREPGNMVDTKSVRGALILSPIDTLQVEARLNYTDSIHGAYHELVSDAQLNDSGTSYLMYSTPLKQFRELYDASLKIDYEIGAVELTSITAGNRARQLLEGEGDFSPAAFALQHVALELDTFSQELRLASTAATGIRWLVGAFYQDRKTDNFLQVRFDDGSGQPDPALGFLIDSRDHGRSKAHAMFGQAVAALGNAWEMTLGLRYDQDKRTSFDPNRPGSPVEATFQAWQPKISLMYRWTGEFQTYFTLARGFRSGGFNAFTSLQVPREYDEETNWSYEAGFKGSFVDGRVLLTGALFYIRMKNEQLFFVEVSPPSQNIETIPATSKTGIELELTARPTADLDVTFGVGTVDSVIEEWAARPATVGNKTYQSNAYNFSASLQYRWQLGETLTLRPYLSAEQRGPIYWDANNRLKTSAKSLVNLRLFLDTPHWSVGAFAKNLTDTLYPVTIGADSFGPGVHFRNQGLRRSYGVEVSARF